MNAAIEDKSLRQDFDLAEPPEKVWRALTEPALVKRWLMPDAAPTTGERPGFTGDGGKLACTLIDAEPGRRVSYAWREDALDSIVTFSIAATNGGTRLTVVHSGQAQTPATAMLTAPGCRMALRITGKMPKHCRAANDAPAPMLLAA